MNNRDSSGRFTKKTGRICHKGYWAVYMPEHPRAKANGYVLEHILVAESKLGRSLLPEEVVHHVDGDKKNNNPDNIHVFSSQKEHAMYHWNEARGQPSLSQMAKRAGKSPSLVYQRVKKLGWSVEDALSK